MPGPTTEQPTPDVTLLADLAPGRPWTADLVGWLGRVAEPGRPVGWARAIGSRADDAVPDALAVLVASGAVLRRDPADPAGVVAVHLDSGPAGLPAAAPHTRVLLDGAAVRRAAAGELPGDAAGLLAALLAGPSAAADADAAGPAGVEQHPADDGAPTVLFVSSNGFGMGHLTRLLAMARRSGPGVRPVFASMSQAVPAVDAEGFAWEYVPSKGDLGIGNRRWNTLCHRRFAELLDRRRPAVLVFDGTYPYDGLLRAVDERPELKVVWSRRGMWYPGQPTPQLRTSSRFDLIVEPGDLAAEADRGATAGRTDAHRVDPITLLDLEEHLPRAEAAAMLGVDPDRPTALITLGAGSEGYRGSLLGQLVDGLAAADPDLQLVLTRPAIRADVGPVADRVHAVSIYPISRCLAAVDLAVSSAGYNSFHELLGAAVPTVLVPTRATPLDDQLARARWADDAGAAVCLETAAGPDAVAAAVARASDPVARAALADRCRVLRRPNGAPAAMAAIAGLLAPVAAR